MSTERTGKIRAYLRSLYERLEAAFGGNVASELIHSVNVAITVDALFEDLIEIKKNNSKNIPGNLQEAIGNKIWQHTAADVISIRIRESRQLLDEHNIPNHLRLEHWWLLSEMMSADPDWEPSTLEKEAIHREFDLGGKMSALLMGVTITELLTDARGAPTHTTGQATH